MTLGSGGSTIASGGMCIQSSSFSVSGPTKSEQFKSYKVVGRISIGII